MHSGRIGNMHRQIFMTVAGVKLDGSVFIMYNLHMNTSDFDKISVVFTDDFKCFNKKCIKSA